MRRAPNRQGKLMPEWEEISAVASAAQNMQLMATSLGVACELFLTRFDTPLVHGLCACNGHKFTSHAYPTLQSMLQCAARGLLWAAGKSEIRILQIVQ